LAEGADDRDEALLAAVAAGDRRAFRALMLRHGPAMLALAERVTGNAADADEIVQACFVKVWAAPLTWRPDRGARFSTWLYRVVLNACLDRRRRAVSLPLDEAGEVAAEQPCGIETALAAERRSIVAQSLDELPERQREALSLYYFSEVTAQQAARILGLSLPAVEALLVRGRKALLRALRRRGVLQVGDLL